jgi:hypothetical protein
MLGWKWICWRLYPNLDKPEPKRFHLIISECIMNIQSEGFGQYPFRSDHLAIAEFDYFNNLYPHFI